jgi:hypothetical protein
MRRAAALLACLLLLTCAHPGPMQPRSDLSQCTRLYVSNTLQRDTLYVWDAAGWLGAVPPGRAALLYGCGAHPTASPVVWLYSDGYGLRTLRLRLGPHMGTGPYVVRVRRAPVPDPLHSL